MYSFEQLMCPVWDSDIVYDESLTMVRNQGVAEAPLLFAPEEILSVTSADKTKAYQEGRDWQVCGNILRLLQGSRIFAFQPEELLFDAEKPGISYPAEGGKYSLLQGGHFFHDRQIAITYRKSEKASFTQAFCGALLPTVLEKLTGGEPVRIVLYGDSIAEGSNSSGITLTTPFLPIWGKLTSEKLARHYRTGVKLINTSKGGMDSRWGMQNARELVGEYAPDLAIIAFGMNDIDEAPQFAENIRKIRDIIARASPATEFILCATTIARPGLNVGRHYRHQAEYRDALLALQEPGTAIADFYKMQMYLMERKRFIDLTGNNVNHPNDFMVRCHAQLICDMLIDRHPEGGN